MIGEERERGKGERERREGKGGVREEKGEKEGKGGGEERGGATHCFCANVESPPQSAVIAFVPASNHCCKVLLCTSLKFLTRSGAPLRQC